MHLPHTRLSYATLDFQPNICQVNVLGVKVGNVWNTYSAYTRLMARPIPCRSISR